MADQAAGEVPEDRHPGQRFRFTLEEVPGGRVALPVRLSGQRGTPVLEVLAVLESVLNRLRSA